MVCERAVDRDLHREAQLPPVPALRPQRRPRRRLRALLGAFRFGGLDLGPAIKFTVGAWCRLDRHAGVVGDAVGPRGCPLSLSRVPNLPRPDDQ